MEKLLITYRQSRMKNWLVISQFAVLSLLALVTACSSAPEQSSSAPGVPSTAATTLSAEQVLQQMSEKLKGAQQLTFKATRQLDAALLEEGDLLQNAQIEFAVARPNRLKARSMSGESVRSFYADGKTVVLFDEDMNLYASVPSAGTIDEMFARFDERYGFTPPLAEFTLNDPYKKLSQQIQSSSNKGLEMMNGVECHHVTATGELADADIWVATSDQLPRRLVVTFKQREGSPQLKADFSEWNLAAKLDDKNFSFFPPQGAEKIEMLTTEQMNEAEQKDEKQQEKQK
jgi:hypothetical protein